MDQSIVIAVQTVPKVSLLRVGEGLRKPSTDLSPIDKSSSVLFDLRRLVLFSCYCL